MKLYAQFYNWHLDGKLHTATGTDQICWIDGRYGLAKAIESAKQYAYRLQNVREFAGFTIQRGNIRQSTCIHSELPIVISESVFAY